MAPSKAWTLSSAARFAREARINTVRHMRDTKVAREWEANLITNAIEVQADATGDLASAHWLVFAGMGYKPPFPSDPQSAADLILTDEARYLASADLFILTPEMCDVVMAAAASLTVEDLELLDPDDLPSRTGLVVLPHPVIVKMINEVISATNAR